MQDQLLKRVFSILIITITIFSACKREGAQTAQSFEQPLFTALSAAESGLNLHNHPPSDPSTKHNLLDYSAFYDGSGVAVGDINNDRLPDLFFTANDAPNSLYINRGNLQFEDISEKAGINIDGWSTGVTMADVNNDGLVDIYVCRSGPGEDTRLRENLLFINNGNETFTEQAKLYGLNDNGYSVQAAFFDYDRDGDLDCFVGNTTPGQYNILSETIEWGQSIKQHHHLYKNNGDGTFTDVTVEANLLVDAYCNSVCVADINQDGWGDLYLTNYPDLADYLYINRGDGTFFEQSDALIRQGNFFTTGCDIADFNNDGFPDICTGALTSGSYLKKTTTSGVESAVSQAKSSEKLAVQKLYDQQILQLHNSNNTYSNIANLAGISKAEWTKSVLLADFDLDGNKDYFATNGVLGDLRDKDFQREIRVTTATSGGELTPRMKESILAKLPKYKLANQLFRNLGDLRLEEKTNSWGMGIADYSSGAAYADLDRDGDLEIVVCRFDESPVIYRNNAREQKRGNYLSILLSGGQLGDPVTLSKVQVFTDGQAQYQELTNSRGYLSAVEPVFHFGLGSSSSVDTLKIFWPNGAVQKYYNVAVNQQMSIAYEPQGAESIHSTPTSGIQIAMIRPGSANLSFVHRENEYPEFADNGILPFSLAKRGPFIATGDVNGDGKEDCYYGGAAGQAGKLFLAGEKGYYQEISGPWEKDADAEDMQVLIFDANDDGLPDLYVVSGGGGEYESGSAILQDRLYINEGGGNFTKNSDALPQMPSHGNCVAPFDFDQDGDVDLFVGGGSNPSAYPSAARSYLLLNENGYFSDVTEEWSGELMFPGDVRDAKWIDLNGDDRPDLIMAGWWMPIRFFINEGNRFREATREWGTADISGWWNTIELADVNNDGMVDILAGNAGANTSFHASVKEPLQLMAINTNGKDKNTLVLSEVFQGRRVPVKQKEILEKQIPSIRERYTTFASYAQADLSELLGGHHIDSSMIKTVTELRSMVFINQGHKEMNPIPLPNEAQISTIQTMIVEDFNKDGKLDLLIGGNDYQTANEIPRLDAGNGLLLLGDGKGGFSPLSIRETGIFLPGNVKDIKLMPTAFADVYFILVANNNAENQVFVWNRQG